MATGQTIGSVFLKVSLDDTKIGDEAKQTGEKVEKSFDSMGNKTDGLKASFTKLGKVIAAAFAVKVVYDFMKACSELTEIQQQAESKITVSMQRRMKATQEEINGVKTLASELQKTGVIGDEVALSGAAALSQYVNSAENLKALLPAMEDLAVAQNGVEVSAGALESTAQMIGMAIQNGTTTRLSRIGVYFSDAEEEAFKLGNEEQRVAILASKIEQNVGGMNTAFANTPTGRLQQLRNSFGDLQEKIGVLYQKLVTLLVPVLDWIVNKLDHLMDKILNSFGLSIEDGVASLGDVMQNSVNTAIDDSADSLDNAKEKAEEYKKTLLGFDEINKLDDPTTTDDTAGTTTTGGSNTITNNSTTLGSVIGGGSTSSSNSAVTKWLDETWEKIEEKWKKLKEKKDKIMTVISVIGKVIKTVWDISCLPLKTIIALGKIIWEGLKKLWNFLQSAGKKIKEWIEAFKEWVQSIFDWFGEKLSWLGEKAGGLWEAITDNPIVNGGKKIISDVGSALGFGEKSSGYTKTAHSRIPAFANGGYVRRNTPQLAVIGDNRTQGEYVLPENKLAEIVGNGRNNQEVISLLSQIITLLSAMNLTADISGDALANLVVRIVNNRTRATGNCPIKV